LARRLRHSPSIAAMCCNRRAVRIELEIGHWLSRRSHTAVGGLACGFYGTANIPVTSAQLADHGVQRIDTSFLDPSADRAYISSAGVLTTHSRAHTVQGRFQSASRRHLHELIKAPDSSRCQKPGTLSDGLPVVRRLDPTRAAATCLVSTRAAFWSTAAATNLEGVPIDSVDPGAPDACISPQVGNSERLLAAAQQTPRSDYANLASYP